MVQHLRVFELEQGVKQQLGMMSSTNQQIVVHNGSKVDLDILKWPKAGW